MQFFLVELQNFFLSNQQCFWSYYCSVIYPNAVYFSQTYIITENMILQEKQKIEFAIKCINLLCNIDHNLILFGLYVVNMSSGFKKNMVFWNFCQVHCF